MFYAVRDSPSKWPYILSSFDGSEYLVVENQDPELGPWGNTSSSAIAMSHRRVHILHLGSDIHSSERSTPEILRRISLASNIFGRLANIWKRTGLSLQT